MNIGAEIIKLIAKHNCVVIPGFGGFVAEVISASYDQRTHVLNAPKKNIVFNKHLINNDGLLANQISYSYSIGYEESILKINEFVIDIKQKLIGKRRLDIESLGVLFLDESGNIQFAQNNGVNYHNDSFGLENLRLIPIIKTYREIENVVFDRVETDSILADKSNVHQRSWLKIAATFIGVPILGILLLFALKSPVTDFVQQASFMSLFDNTSPTYSPAQLKMALLSVEKEEIPLLTDSDGMFSLKISTSKNIKPLLVKIEAIADTSRVVKIEFNRIPSVSNFYIIVGCFANTDNANRLIGNLQEEGYAGANAGIAKNGLTRVGIGGFNTLTFANNELNNIKSKYPNAWVYEKR